MTNQTSPVQNANQQSYFSRARSFVSSYTLSPIASLVKNTVGSGLQQQAEESFKQLMSEDSTSFSTKIEEVLTHALLKDIPLEFQMIFELKDLLEKFSLHPIPKSYIERLLALLKNEQFLPKLTGFETLLSDANALKEKLEQILSSNNNSNDSETHINLSDETTILSKKLLTSTTAFIDQNQGSLIKAVNFLISSLMKSQGLMDLLEKRLNAEPHRLLFNANAALKTLFAELGPLNSDKLPKAIENAIPSLKILREKKSEIFAQSPLKEEEEKDLFALLSYLEQISETTPLDKKKALELIQKSFNIITPHLELQKGIIRKTMENLNAILQEQGGFLDTLEMKLNDPNNGILSKTIALLTEKFNARGGVADQITTRFIAPAHEEIQKTIDLLLSLQSVLKDPNSNSKDLLQRQTQCLSALIDLDHHKSEWFHRLPTEKEWEHISNLSKILFQEHEVFPRAKVLALIEQVLPILQTEKGVILQIVDTLNLLLQDPQGPLETLNRALNDTEKGILAKAIALLKEKFTEKGGLSETLSNTLNHEPAQELLSLQKILLQLINALQDKTASKQVPALAQSTAESLKKILDHQTEIFQLKSLSQTEEQQLQLFYTLLNTPDIQNNQNTSQSLETLQKMVQNFIQRETGMILQTVDILKGKLTDEETGLLVQAVDLLTQKLSAKDGLLEKVNKQLNAQPHALLEQTRKALLALISSVEEKKTLESIVPLIQNFLSSLELLEKNEAEVFGSNSFNDQEKMTLQQMKEFLMAIGSNSQFDPHLLLSHLQKTLKIFDFFYEKQKGILRQTIDTLNALLVMNGGPLDILRGALTNEESGLITDALKLLDQKFFAENGFIDKLQKQLQHMLSRGIDAIFDRANQNLTKKGGTLDVLNQALNDPKHGLAAKLVHVITDTVFESNGLYDTANARANATPHKLLEKIKPQLEALIEVLKQENVSKQSLQRLALEAQVTLAKVLSKTDKVFKRPPQNLELSPEQLESLQNLQFLLFQFSSGNISPNDKDRVKKAYKVIKKHYKSQQGTAHQLGTVISQTVHSAVQQTVLPVIQQVDNKVNHLMDRVENVIPQTIENTRAYLIGGNPQTLRSTPRDNTSPASLPQKNSSEITPPIPLSQDTSSEEQPQQLGSFLAKMQGMLGVFAQGVLGFASKKTISAMASGLLWVLDAAKERVSDNEQALQAIQQVVTAAKNAQKDGNVGTLLSALGECIEKVNDLPIYVNGVRLPTLGTSPEDTSSAVPELQTLIDHFNEVQQQESHENPTPINPRAATEIEQQKMIQNISAYAPIKLAYGTIGGLDGIDDQILIWMRDANLQSNRDEYLKLKLYEALDTAYANGHISLIRLCAAKIAYVFIVPLVSFLTDKFTNSFVEWAHQYFDSKNNDAMVQFGFQNMKHATRYLYNLGGAFKSVADRSGLQTNGNIDEMVSEELSKPEHNDGFTQKELQNAVIHRAVDQFAPKLGWTKTISQIFEAVAGENVPLRIFMRGLSSVINAFVILPEWIGDAIIGGVLKAAFIENNTLEMLLDKSMSAMKDKNGHTYAVKSVLYDQLLKLYGLLAHANFDDATSGFSSLQTSQPDLEEFMVNLIDVVKKSECKSKADLEALFYRKSPKQQIREAIDALAIDDVVDLSIKLMAIGYKSIMDKEQMEKQLHNFLTLINKSYEVGQPITNEQCEQLDRKLTQLTDKVISLAIHRALDYKLDFNGEKMQAKAKKILSSYREDVSSFVLSTKELLENLHTNLEMQDSNQSLIQIDQAIHSAKQFIEGVINLENDIDGSDLDSDIKHRFNRMTKELKEKLQQLQIHLCLIRKAKDHTVFQESLIAKAEEMRRQLQLLSEILSQKNLSSQNSELAINCLKSIVSALSAFDGVQGFTSFKEQMQSQIKHMQIDLEKLKAAAKTTENLMQQLLSEEGIQSLQRLVEMKKNQIQGRPHRALSSLVRQFSEMIEQLPHAHVRTTLKQAFDHLLICSDINQIDQKHQSFVGQIQGSLHHVTQESSSLNECLQKNVQDMNLTILFSKILDKTPIEQDAQSTSLHLQKAIELLDREKWTDLIKEIPFINLSISDMKWFTNFAKNFAFKQIKERIKGLEEFLTHKEYNYRYGLFNHILFLPFIKQN